MPNPAEHVAWIRAAIEPGNEKLAFSHTDVQALLAHIDYLLEQNRAEVAHASELRRQLKRR